MSGELFKGKWHQIKGKVKEKWGKLTDDDLMRVNGKAEELLGILQEKYGWEKKQAEEELKRFEKTLDKMTEQEPKRKIFPLDKSNPSDDRNDKKRKIG